MLDATSRKLLQLLHPSTDAEYRAAAVLIAPLLAGKEKAWHDAITEALADPDEKVRLGAVVAVGKLKAESALPRLLEKIRNGGEEAEIAARSAAQMGAKAVRALQALMKEVAPGLRRRIAGALGSGHTASAATAALDALLDSDQGVVEAATRSLIAEVPSLVEHNRKAWTEHILELLQQTTSDLSIHSRSALLRLLAALGDSRAEALFWDYAAKGMPSDLRAVAMQALGSLRISPSKDKLGRLIEAALDRDFRIAAPGLLMLQGASVQKKQLEQWHPLFFAPDPAVRKFAIEKLGASSDEIVIESLIQQIDHADKQLRLAAVAALGAQDVGRQRLLDRLIEADSVDKAWNLARAQAPLAGSLDGKQQEQLVKAAFAALEDENRKSDALFFLLRELDERTIRDKLEARAIALRKKAQYEKANLYFRLLSRDPACGEELRFEAAACALKLSTKDLSADHRATDPALHQFVRLIHSHDVPLQTRLAKAKWITPEEHYYLGFQFAGGDAAERAVAKDILEGIVKTNPKARLAKDAKNKLRTAGLSE